MPRSAPQRVIRAYVSSSHHRWHILQAHAVADRHAPLWINARYNRHTPTIHINKKRRPASAKARHGAASFVIHKAKLRITACSSIISRRIERGEIKKMQNRRKSSRRRTSVRQRRFSAVEKAKTLFYLLKESARIPTSFSKSDYTKTVIQ